DGSWPHAIYASERIVAHKSVFLAHATSLTNSTLLPQFIDHLTRQPQLKRATHCMYAYRVRVASQGSESAQFTLGQQDGGESGSGDLLARLLALSECENVVIVVSRWYGGVKLGSERWRRISEVARDALALGGFSRKREKAENQSKKKKRKK
ncbi:ribosomal protein S5 domain 2-like protein, partial [Hymenopellis radicata]